MKGKKDGDREGKLIEMDLKKNKSKVSNEENERKDQEHLRKRHLGRWRKKGVAEKMRTRQTERTRLNKSR